MPITLPSFVMHNYTKVTTTKVTEDYTEEETVLEATTTTLSPPKPPDDIPKVDTLGEDKNTSVVKNEEATGNDSPLTVIPLVAISGLVVIVAGVMFFIWKKNQTPKASSKKEDMVSYINELFYIYDIKRQLQNVIIITNYNIMLNYTTKTINSSSTIIDTQ